MQIWHLQFLPSHCCISFLKLFMEVANFTSININQYFSKKQRHLLKTAPIKQKKVKSFIIKLLVSKIYKESKYEVQTLLGLCPYHKESLSQPQLYFLLQKACQYRLQARMQEVKYSPMPKCQAVSTTLYHVVCEIT